MSDFDSTDMAEAMGFQDHLREILNESGMPDANAELAERLTAILTKLGERGVLTEDELRLLAYASGIKL